MNSALPLRLPLTAFQKGSRSAIPECISRKSALSWENLAGVIVDALQFGFEVLVKDYGVSACWSWTSRACRECNDA